MSELDEIKAKRYDSMGFQNEHGMWVRWADFDRLLGVVEEMRKDAERLKRVELKAFGVISAHHRGLPMETPVIELWNALDDKAKNP